MPPRTSQDRCSMSTAAVGHRYEHSKPRAAPLALTDRYATLRESGVDARSRTWAVHRCADRRLFDRNAERPDSLRCGLRLSQDRDAGVAGALLRADASAARAGPH